MTQRNERVLAPDEARIATDLKGHTLFASNAPMDTRLAGSAEAQWTAIRSSVRKGEVLEFRVTSMYPADANDGPRREVDSIVSYQLNAEGWALVGVRMEGTRIVASNEAESPGKSC